MKKKVIEVVVDDRGRVSLAGLVEKNRIYFGRRFEDGSVILEPATMPRTQLGEA